MDIFFIVDAVLILILVFSVINGYMRGLILTAASLFGIIAGWFMGKSVAGAFSGRFNQAFIAPLFGEILPGDEDTVTSLIDHAADSAVSGLSGSISYFILFVITAIIVYALITIIGRVIDRVFELPLLSLLNKLGGIAAGFVIGIVVLFAIGAACVLTAGIVSEFLMMPEIYDYINGTKVLLYLTQHNPFLAS